MLALSFILCRKQRIILCKCSAHGHFCQALRHRFPKRAFRIILIFTESKPSACVQFGGYPWGPAKPKSIIAQLYFPRFSNANGAFSARSASCCSCCSSQFTLSTRSRFSRKLMRLPAFPLPLRLPLTRLKSMCLTLDRGTVSYCAPPVERPCLLMQEKRYMQQESNAFWMGSASRGWMRLWPPIPIPTTSAAWRNLSAPTKSARSIFRIHPIPRNPISTCWKRWSGLMCGPKLFTPRER